MWTKTLLSGLSTELCRELRLRVADFRRWPGRHAGHLPSARRRPCPQHVGECSADCAKFLSLLYFCSFGPILINLNSRFSISHLAWVWEVAGGNYAAISQVCRPSFVTVGTLAASSHFASQEVYGSKLNYKFKPGREMSLEIVLKIGRSRPLFLSFCIIYCTIGG